MHSNTLFCNKEIKLMRWGVKMFPTSIHLLADQTIQFYPVRSHLANEKNTETGGHGAAGERRDSAATSVSLRELPLVAARPGLSRQEGS
jgi:hypothetical protein